MWVLGSQGLAEHYYPDDNANVQIDSNLNWTLGVYNHMGSIQYVEIQVKLMNSTVSSPDEPTGKPSPLQPLVEFTRVLVENETWSIPFNWTILNLSQTGSMMTITELSINENHFEGGLAIAVSGFNYRFVFELWFYDQAGEEMTFSWKTEDYQHSVWTQIWFNATAPIP